MTTWAGLFIGGLGGLFLGGFVGYMIARDSRG